MKHFRDVFNYKEQYDTALTIGKFDGLHRGHQQLIEKIQELSQEHGLKSAVCAMDFTPVWQMNGLQPEVLMTRTERANRLEGKVDFLVEAPFTKRLSQMSPEVFAREVIRGIFRAKYVVVGRGFRFGFERSGDVETLNRLGEAYGFEAIIIPNLKEEETVISSTVIKQLLKNGEIQRANRLLGYEYGYTGVVEQGNHIGRTLGFPTLNVHPWEGKVLPPYGVYETQVVVDGRTYRGITNIGMKPTVERNKRLLIESYLFDFSGNAYGKKVSIQLCSFKRPEKKFSSLEELKEAIAEDLKNSFT